MKILVIKLGAMGDVLRTTSILPALKKKYHDAHINWLTKKSSKYFLVTNILVNSIFLIESDEDKKEILAQEYDLVINLDDEEEVCKIAAKIKKSVLFGAYEKNGEKTYSNDSAPWFDMGLISKYGKKEADRKKIENKKTYQEIIFQALGLESYIDYPPQLTLKKKYLEFGEKFAERNNISTKAVIGINTGAGGRWQDKKLSAQQTVELIDGLHKNEDIHVILFGGPEEKERNKEILEKVSTPLIDGGCDNSLLEFSSLVNLCDVLVTSDSLAMHIGIALRKKVIAFFYPTSAAEIELYGKGQKVVAEGRSYCSYQEKCEHPPKWNISRLIKAVGKELE